MVLEFETQEDFLDYLYSLYDDEKNADIMKTETDILWKKLKEKELFLEFNKTEGYWAYYALQNSYALFYSLLELMKKSESSEKESEVLSCILYNFFLEKIADFFKIILDIPKLVGAKKSFYSAAEIIDTLEKLISEEKENSDLFRFANRRIRNALAHFDFNLYSDSLIYTSSPKWEKKHEHIALPFPVIKEASLNLNMLACFLFKKIENRLKEFEDSEKTKEVNEPFKKELEKLRENCRNFDCL